jgi:hypothetical protein
MRKLRAVKGASSSGYNPMLPDLVCLHATSCLPKNLSWSTHVSDSYIRGGRPHREFSAAASPPHHATHFTSLHHTPHLSTPRTALHYAARFTVSY